MSRRLAVSLALVAALGALMGWWANASMHGTIGHGALRDPEDGLQHTVSLFEVTELRPPDRYVLRRGVLQVVVVGEPEGLQVGEEWTVSGTFRRGELVEAWRQPAPGRPAKKALGFLGLALAAGIAASRVRVTGEGLRLDG